MKIRKMDIVLLIIVTVYFGFTFYFYNTVTLLNDHAKETVFEQESKPQRPPHPWEVLKRIDVHHGKHIFIEKILSENTRSETTDAVIIDQHGRKIRVIFKSKINIYMVRSVKGRFVCINKKEHIPTFYIVWVEEFSYR